MGSIRYQALYAGLATCLALGTARSAAAGEAPAWRVGTPIVTYWAGPPMTDATARQMSDGGFNLVWCRENELDTAQRHGLRAMLFAPELLRPAALEDPDQRSRLDALVDRVSGHAALYCYFIVDEPSAAAFAGLGKLTAYLRSRDPAHMAYINLFPTYASNEQLGTTGDTVTAYREHLRQFVAAVRPALISYDHYQFASGGDLEGYFLNLAMIRETAISANVPFLNIVQACSWTPVRRVPDQDEMRYLVSTTLAYGAQGISYYVYCHPGHNGGIAQADGSPTPLYAPLAALNREFAAVAAQLQPLRSLAVYHAGMQPAGTVPWPTDLPYRLDPPQPALAYQPPERIRGVVLGLFGPADAVTPPARQATHLMLVNLDYRQALETTLVGPAPLEAFEPGDVSWTAAGGPRLLLRLPPGGGRLIRQAPPH